MARPADVEKDFQNRHEPVPHSCAICGYIRSGWRVESSPPRVGWGAVSDLPRLAVACQTVASPELAPQRHAQGGHDVLDRVVLVDLDVSGRDRFQVEAAVECELGQQVVEKADAGVGARSTSTVERERYTERRLGG